MTGCLRRCKTTAIGTSASSKKRSQCGLLHISATTLHNLPGQQLITDLPKPQNTQRFSRRSSPKMGCVD